LYIPSEEENSRNIELLKENARNCIILQEARLLDDSFALVQAIVQTKFPGTRAIK
jgi:hypothetical protein